MVLREEEVEVGRSLTDKGVPMTKHRLLLSSVAGLVLMFAVALAGLGQQQKEPPKIEPSKDVPQGSFSNAATSQDIAGKKALDDMRPFYLVNKRADVVFVGVRVNGSAWQPLNPAVGQTCTIANDYSCAQQGKWRLIFYGPCGQAISADLLDRNSGVWTGQPYTVDCKYSYGWYVVR
jgi:hypothetical protein